MLNLASTKKDKRLRDYRHTYYGSFFELSSSKKMQLSKSYFKLRQGRLEKSQSVLDYSAGNRNFGIKKSD